MNLSFENKVALVTGAASGIGFATAKAFAESGASVALADVSDSAVRAATDKLLADGHSAIAIQCDVADEASVAAMISQVLSSLGRLDAAYNNAGIQIAIKEMADVSNEEYDRVMSINLRGIWNCMKHELKHMRDQGRGWIVNCSSIGGLVGNPGLAAYHATKYGVLYVREGLVPKTEALSSSMYAFRGGSLSSGRSFAELSVNDFLLTQVLNTVSYPTNIFQLHFV